MKILYSKPKKPQRNCEGTNMKLLKNYQRSENFTLENIQLMQKKAAKKEQWNKESMTMQAKKKQNIRCKSNYINNNIEYHEMQNLIKRQRLSN